MPVLDRLTEQIERQSLPKVALLLFLFSCYSAVTCRFYDPFFLNKGYSFIWLSILYFIGALIRKFELYKSIDNKKRKQIGVAMFGMLLISWIWYLCPGNLIQPEWKSLFAEYVSPTILGISVGLLLILAGTNFKSKWICFASSSTFGVYLIHDNNLIRHNFIAERFVTISQFSPIWMPSLVLFSAIVIFTVCCALDKFRVCVFNLIQAKKGSDSVEAWLRILIQKITMRS